MELLITLVYLAFPVLVIAWLLAWRRNNRERRRDVQERLERIERTLGIRQ